MMQETVIIEALRSPRGRGSPKGALAGVTPLAILAEVLRALAARVPALVEASDAIVGCVTQTGEQGANIARLATIAAGLPDSLPALTVNRYCASGLAAIRFAALAAKAADGLALAGGVESMSRVPMAADQGPLTHDAAFQAKAALFPIGLQADAIATLYGFDRAACDAYAAESQARAAAAAAAGRFRALVPVEGLAADETPRPGTTVEQLATLPPAFADFGVKTGLAQRLAERLGLPALAHVHHAGNSPAPADGAAALVLASRAAAGRLGLRPRARLLALAELGTDRLLALTGAVDAARAALAQAGLPPDAIDHWEVNESFAAPMLHFVRALGIPRARLNPNGGAIALGHPMGATGAVLVSMAIDALEDRGGGRALVAAVGATGLAAAAILEVPA